MSKTTLAQIDAKDFTFCSAVYDNPLTFRKFIVGTHRVTEARQRAHDYAERTWGTPRMIRYYPRTYIRDARKLFALGMHD